MGFRFAPYSIGEYEIVAGTAKYDNLTGLGAQAVFGGPGNDILTGYSQTTDDGQWQIAPILSGGQGNDTYLIRTGAWNFIADLNGGKDTIRTSMSIRNVSFAVINGRDILATDGSTTTILVDPLGIESADNKIETVYFGKTKYSASKLYKLAVNSSNYLGAFTYTELEDQGLLNFSITGLNPSQINSYIAAGRVNNTLVS